MSNLAPIRNIKIHGILDYFPISQSNHYNIVMASICTDQCCIRPPAILGLEQYVLFCSIMHSDKNIYHQAKLFILLSHTLLSHAHSFYHHSMPCIRCIQPSIVTTILGGGGGGTTLRPHLPVFPFLSLYHIFAGSSFICQGVAHSICFLMVCFILTYVLLFMNYKLKCTSL